jgi:hypothetical protein
MVTNLANLSLKRLIRRHLKRFEDATGDAIIIILLLLVDL